MGSIEVFPRRNPGPFAEAWRAAPVPGGGTLRVREARLEDYAALRALQRHAAPHLPPLTLRQFESRRHAFAEGQWAAVCDGQIVGAASSLVVRCDDYGVEHTWKSLTGDGFFTTHDPRGRTLFGADIVVDPTRRGFGVARALHQARKRLCRKLNLKRIAATARLEGYRAVRDEMSPETYAMRILWGEIADDAWRFQASQGFRYCGILRGYLPDDGESCGHAALLAWLNPLYAPPGPPAIVEPQRARQCA